MLKRNYLIYIFAVMAVAMLLSSCAGTSTRQNSFSPIDSGDEYDGVFKLSLKQTQSLVEKVLKSHKLQIKNTRKEKRGTEIYASSYGTKVSVKLESIGLSTKVTVWAKKYRIFSDADTARNILKDIEERLYSQEKTASTTFK